MSYPQAIASQEIIEGQEIYRLKTPLDSSGDAYELDVGVKAFAIGPESDVARARVTYFDPIQGVHSFVVSVGSPFVGRVDAFPNKIYEIANSPAVIIVTPEDIVEAKESLYAAFTGLDPVYDIVGFTKPRLDLVAYLSEPKVIPLRRADYIQRGLISVHNHSGDNFSGSGTTYLFVPFYRRKYASFKFRNDSGNSYTYSIKGCSFLTSALTSDAGVARIHTSGSTALATAAVGAGAHAAPEIRASLHGLWDYLAISIAGTGLDSTAGSSSLSYTLELTDEET